MGRFLTVVALVQLLVAAPVPQRGGGISFDFDSCVPGEVDPAFTPEHYSHLQDRNMDGFLDLITYYRVQATGISCGDESATLTGRTSTQEFAGMDSVWTVGCR